MPLETGKVLNSRYRIVSLLGQGGFGAVYRAWDLNLKRPCAVKENLETNLQGQQQFENEATILANLSHPHLPRVTDHFVLPGQGQYLVMDFVEGQDLNAVLSLRGLIPIREAVDWISQIASALDYLHTQKRPVIHRDIKPANIRVTSDGRAFLVDFGLVKLFQTQVYTTPGARGVTPGFSPPEQYGQGGTDARTDIYGLAATLYTLLTGKIPPESVHRYGQDKLSRANIENPNVPMAVALVIEKAMSLDPANRYLSSQEFKSALDSALSAPVMPGTVVSPQRGGTVVAPQMGGTVVVPPVNQVDMGTVTLQPSNPLITALKENRLVQAGLVILVLIVGYGLVTMIQPPVSETQTPTSQPFSAVSGITDTPTFTEMPPEPPEPDGSTITPTETVDEPAPQDATDTPKPSDTPPPTETDTPTPAIPTYDLVFASDRKGEFQAVAMDTQTGEYKGIANPSGYERSWWPSFCGTRVAVELSDLNGSESQDQWIYFLDIINGAQERLTSPGSPESLGVPRCSPTSGFLAYSAKVSAVWQMFITDFSSTFQVSPPDALVSGYASWPTSGYDLIFQVITQDDFRNLIYQMDGHPSGDQYRYIDTGGNPSISPNGSQMTYSCESDGDYRTICISSIDGSNVATLVKIKREKVGNINVQPSTYWSSDGQWIYFASAADGDWDIYRIRPNGSGVENLTEDWDSSNEIMPAVKW